MKKPIFIYPFWALFLIFFAGLVGSSNAQIAQPPAPRQEKLLNGLTVLMWNDSKADKVTLKVRVHAGSAFDPQGKEGLMKLLAAHIFPTDEAKEFFSDELGGSLEIVSNYDYIQVNATAKPDKLLELLETVANAINNIVIDKESIAKLRPKQLEDVRRLEKDAVYAADLAASQRLLGTFPYGRPQVGNPDSLARIDFADVLFARERFFTADNATVAISGNFDQALAFRALRRYFGNWLKADKKTPTAFRQPDAPDTKLLSVKFDAPGSIQYRYALRGVARNDKDFAAAEILARVLEGRLSATSSVREAVVRSDSHVLPGVVVIGYSSPNAKSEEIMRLLSTPVTQEEFSKAAPSVVGPLSARSAADWWLDAQTYKVTSVADDVKAINSVSLADVTRVQERLAKSPIASISLVPTSAVTSN